jgi:hypothetical protein
MLGIKHPIILAGMAAVSNAELGAAVSNAGGMAIVGGAQLSPEGLRKVIKELKERLDDKNAPFGVDLLLPQVGGNARKTNYDYTHGTLDELVDIGKCRSDGVGYFPLADCSSRLRLQWWRRRRPCSSAPWACRRSGLWRSCTHTTS